MAVQETVRAQQSGQERAHEDDQSEIWFRSERFLFRPASSNSLRLISRFGQRKVKQASERDFRYQSIMRNLVRRYVTVEQRKAESEGVTEDDVNEIKQDISALRCELIEILKNSGMNTSTASGTGTGEQLAFPPWNLSPTILSSLPILFLFLHLLRIQFLANFARS